MPFYELCGLSTTSSQHSQRKCMSGGGRRRWFAAQTGSVCALLTSTQDAFASSLWRQPECPHAFNRFGLWTSAAGRCAGAAGRLHAASQSAATLPLGAAGDHLASCNCHGATLPGFSARKPRSGTSCGTKTRREATADHRCRIIPIATTRRRCDHTARGSCGLAARRRCLCTVLLAALLALRSPPAQQRNAHTLFAHHAAAGCTNPVGVHALVFAGDWSEASATTAVVGAKAAGYDMVRRADGSRLGSGMWRHVHILVRQVQPVLGGGAISSGQPTFQVWRHWRLLSSLPPTTPWLPPAGAGCLQCRQNRRGHDSAAV